MTEYLSGAVAACLIIGSAMLAVLLVSGYVVPASSADQHMAQIPVSATQQTIAGYGQPR